ncbi:transcription cofactor vestigial-like protein 4 isoform X2 [Nerophis ophidion]|uniref:transcription cofactor vestigial-like protein 4 isoform X2 n=1 Tax=Nerophis ophidion TaxID=159077 RepID=UPI002AE03AF1|nr:transcription cofactor vestigial-like protein 4 isoform X2 [Nerophis ophidion]
MLLPAMDLLDPQYLDKVNNKVTAMDLLDPQYLDKVNNKVTAMDLLDPQYMDKVTNKVPTMDLLDPQYLDKVNNKVPTMDLLDPQYLDQVPTTGLLDPQYLDQVPTMGLLNPQYLDKVNNNMGRLHYAESSSMSNMSAPPPLCPSKRKYGDEQKDQINCDDDHMNKMSRLFATHLSRPSAGDKRNEHWNASQSAVEHIGASANGLHGNRLYASISGYAVDQPLALTKNSFDSAVGGGERSVVERQQNRPSVITCAPASNRNCNLSHCHMNGCSPSPPDDGRKNNVCDPVIEEHFRRSLGKNYKEAEAAADSMSNSVSITGSVDDHFAKALGDTWLQLKAKGHQAPEEDP